MCLGQLLVNLLQGVALCVDVIELEITVGNDVLYVLAHRSPGDAEFIGGFAGSPYDGLYIFLVPAFAVELDDGGGVGVENLLQAAHVIAIVHPHVVHHLDVATTFHK